MSRSRIRIRLERLAMGNPGDHKPVGRGVQELRMTWGPGYRIYFGQEGEKVVILLAGGDKDTQSADIPKAQAYWADYEDRKDEDHQIQR